MNKVEQVARALCEASCQTWVEPPFNHLCTDALNNHWRYKARAVIAAMAEPTSEMIAAGWRAVSTGKKGAGIARLGPGPGLTDGYKAMIASLLDEG